MTTKLRDWSRFGRGRRQLSVCIIVLALTAVTVGSAWAAPGDLDTSFDTDGIAQTGLIASSQAGYGVAVSPSGDTVYLATFDADNLSGNFLQAYVAAFDSSTGALRAGFGTGGIAHTGLIGSSEAGYGVAVTPAGGTVYVATRASGPSTSSSVAALDATTGTLKAGFGTGGIAYTGIAGDLEAGYGVAVSPTGDRVYVTTFDASTFEAYVAAFDTTTGALDTSLDGDGIAYTGRFGSSRAGYGVAVSPTGDRTYVSTYDASTFAAYVAAFDTTTGALDTSFDGDGIAYTGRFGSSSAG